MIFIMLQFRVVYLLPLRLPSGFTITNRRFCTSSRTRETTHTIWVLYPKYESRISGKCPIEFMTQHTNFFRTLFRRAGIDPIDQDLQLFTAQLGKMRLCCALHLNQPAGVCIAWGDHCAVLAARQGGSIAGQVQPLNGAGSAAAPTASLQ